MIPILFESNAKNFDTYGIGVLRDATSCEITEERNGPYELTLKYQSTVRFTLSSERTHHRRKA